MSMWRVSVCAAAFVGIFAASGPLAVQAGEDPIEYCKAEKHVTEDKCIKFFGTQSPYYSRSGNTGGARQVEGQSDNSLYMIFLHTGSGPASKSAAEGAGSDPLAKPVAGALQAKGYFVRGADTGFDEFGPGVDYFYEQDGAGAADVAAIVNALLPNGATPLRPRLQIAKNPPGFLGVWLHGSAKQSGSATFPDFRKALQSDDMLERRSARRSFAEQGSAAFDEIDKFLGSNVYRLKLGALVALSYMPEAERAKAPPSIRSKVQQLLNDTDEDMREAAARASRGTP